MKHYLILIVLAVSLVSGCAYGQKLDTTKVIMLVCDTIPRYELESVHLGDISKFVFNESISSLYCIYGYEVTKTKWVDTKIISSYIDDGLLFQKIDGFSETTHISWLNEYKITLPPTTVIWQTKSIK